MGIREDASPPDAMIPSLRLPGSAAYRATVLTAIISLPAYFHENLSGNRGGPKNAELL
jgi:hypothetical protein